MDENHDLTENADEVLFAVDLVKYVMKRIAAVEIRQWRAEKYRKIIYNAFNETTINAIENLELTELVDEDLEELVREHGDLNRTIYDIYAKEICDVLFPMGFDPGHILPYSARIAHMAAQFAIRGVLDIHKLAISNIVKAFERFDETTGGWDIFKRQVECYATMVQSYEIISIPQNAEKTLFSKDLICYVMLLNANVKKHSCRVEEKYRNTIYSGLGEITKEAIRYLNNTMEIIEDDIFTLMCKHKFVDIDTYETYASSTYNYYFSKRYDAKNFLPFCTHLARLAAYFYENGVPNAPELAILKVECIFEVFVSSPGGWDTLNKHAEKYAFMARDSQSKLFPSSLDPADIAEDKITQYKFSGENSINQAGDDSDKTLVKADRNSATQDQRKRLQTQQRLFIKAGSSNSKTPLQKILKKRKTGTAGL